MDSMNALLHEISIPKMTLVRQHLSASGLSNPAAALRAELARQEIRSLVRPGMSVAITMGSRGIDAYLPLVCQLVTFLTEMGCKPFLVPAMGSHGGATPAGQTELLSSYGITEERVGAPIRATMEVVEVAHTSTGEPVYMDRYAWEADGIVLMNRVKPHTGFRGDFESGLVKMAGVGLGKQKGAQTIHSEGPATMSQRVQEFGTLAIQNGPILFGVATVENARDRVCEVKALTVAEIFDQEPHLLDRAKAQLPRIPFEHLDVLVIDRIGKNISGPGMDPNITHTYLPGAAIPPNLRDKRAQRVVVLDLTEETHGSAMGIGMADITTHRLFSKMSLENTYPNCLTSGTTVSAKIPMMFGSQRLAIQAAIQTLTGVDRSKLRMVRIADTLHLEEMWISECLLPEVEQATELELLPGAEPMCFDQDGNLF